MQVRILGPVDLVGDDGGPVALGGAKERLLLAVLAVHADEIVSESRLIDALWSREPPRTATKTLQAYVSRLRRVLDEGTGLAIETADSGYRLVVEGDATDVARSEALVLAGREASGAGDHGRASALLREAEAMWRGPSLGEVAAEPFALAEAARLDELRLVVTEERVETELACGRHAELAAELEALTTTHPLRERLWGARMLALYRSGRQAEALRAFQDLRTYLGEELGLDPSAEVRALEEAILRQDPALDLVAVSTPPARATRAPLPSGIVTFLLTDVEGSTRLWDQHPRSMAEALARHDAMLAELVEANGGVLLKSRGEGDSTFSVFGRTSDAAGAAVTIQEALASEEWPEGIQIRVRMAIHMGEAVERDGDYYGPAVNRVARLRAIAEGGEILVSRSAAELLTDHVDGDWSLVEVGERELKDLSRPEHVFSLVPTNADDRVGALAATTPVPPTDIDVRPAAGAAPAGAAADQARGARVPHLPNSLAGHARVVGRDRELERLRKVWETATTQRHRALFVGGEAGIGKSAVAAAFAEAVHTEGAIVLHGRCDEEFGVPYQPFAEALRGLVEGAPIDLTGVGGVGELARLVTDLTVLVPGVPEPTHADPEAERWALFEAVAAVLAAASQAAPVLLVVDDLHWAAKPTLVMLRHLLRSERPARLLVLGTYRDVEVDDGHPLGDLFLDLHRDGLGERLSLAGLDFDGIGALVATTAGHDLDERAAELVTVLHRETNGNPLFIGEFLRHLAETGTIYRDAQGRWASDLRAEHLSLPATVRDLVGQRVGRLSEAARAALTVGALIGPSFELRLLEALPEAGEADRVLDALDEAVSAGLLDEEPGVYTFAHALVRHALVETIGPTRRMRLHRKIGEAIERLPEPEQYVEALAHHFAEAAADGLVDTAAHYGLAAARRALDRLAHEEAAQRLERALAILDAQPDQHHGARADLLIEMTGVRSVIGPRLAGRDSAIRAAHEAMAAQDTERFVRAVVVGGRFGQVGAPDHEILGLLEAGMEQVRDEDPISWARLAGEMAFLIGSNGEGRRDEALELASRALEIARTADDPVVLGRALHARASALLGTPRVDEWMELAVEIMELKEALDDSFLAGFGVSYLATGALMRGERDEFEQIVGQMVQLEQSSRSWYPGYFVRAWRVVAALIDGRWDDAEAGLPDLLEHGEGDPNAMNVWQADQLLLARDRGDLEPMLALIEATVADNPGIHAFEAAHGIFLAELGRLDQARALLAGPVATRFESVPGDQVWPVTMALYATIAARTGDVEAAEILLGALQPFTGLVLASAAATFCFGSADRFLGMLHLTLGHVDEAERHFIEALAIEEGLRSRPNLARTRTWLGRMLLQRGGPGDTERARGVLAEALADTDELGMVGVAAEIRGLLGDDDDRSRAA